MQLQLENTSTGKVYDLSDASTDVEYEAAFNDGASRFSFQCIDPDMVIQEGSLVSFRYKGTDIFFGVVFETSRNEKGRITATCYDQLRYLKDKDTRIRVNMTLTQLVTQIAADRGLRVGKMDDSGVVLGKYIFEGSTDLDTIYASINDNLLANSYWYRFADDFGALTLTDLRDMMLPLAIGDQSLAAGYSYGRSIDSDTFNRVKLARTDKETGIQHILVVEDGANIAKWGNLQYFETVDENMNEGQMNQLANAILKTKNRVVAGIDFDGAIGDARVKAGSGIKLEIASAGINQWAFVRNVTHHFGHSIHTMDLSLDISTDYLMGAL